MNKPNLNRVVKSVATLLLTLLLSNKVLAKIYIYVDQEGNQYFSQKKENKNYQALLGSKDYTFPESFTNWKQKSYADSRIPGNKKLQQRYHPLIVQAARQYQLEPAFIHAVITAESYYQPNAVSAAGAKGLMQLMPVTAQRFGVKDPFDPKQSIYAGTEYLNSLLKEFKTKKLALAAYNAGEGTVRRYNRQIPPYPETQRYVLKVMDFYRYYQNNL